MAVLEILTIYWLISSLFNLIILFNGLFKQSLLLELSYNISLSACLLQLFSHIFIINFSVVQICEKKFLLP